MRILYVTGMWDGLADALFHGLPPRGMPAFHRPLQALIERGHQVDLLIATPEVKPLAIECDWLKQARVTLVPRAGGRGLKAIQGTLGLYSAVRSRLAQERYDFVYGHGPLGPVGVLAARRAGVPCGQRTYGTFMASRVTGDRLSPARKLRLFLRHPLEYLCFSLPKDFQLITNDGSRGDRVFNAIGCPRTTMHYWVNGTEMAADTVSPSDLPVHLDAPYLLYPARISVWKQQHLAVELLAELASRGRTGVRLFFAGHQDDAQYLAELQHQVQASPVRDQVEFLGPVTPPVLKSLMEHSLAVLSFYNEFNLGNVAIEALACGAVLLTLDDGSLNAFLTSGESGFLVQDMPAAARVVEQLLDSPALVARVQAGARRAALEHFPTWTERISREIALIENAVANARGGSPA